MLWTVNKKEEGDLHFNTRQYRHIIWTDEAELQEELYYLVSGLIGRQRRRGP